METYSSGNIAVNYIWEAVTQYVTVEIPSAMYRCFLFIFILVFIRDLYVAVFEGAQQE